MADSPKIWKKLTVQELKVELAKRNLDTSGKKADLVARLTELEEEPVLICEDEVGEVDDDCLQALMQNAPEISEDGKEAAAENEKMDSGVDGGEIEDKQEEESLAVPEQSKYKDKGLESISDEDDSVAKNQNESKDSTNVIQTERMDTDERKHSGEGKDTEIKQEKDSEISETQNLKSGADGDSVTEQKEKLTQYKIPKTKKPSSSSHENEPEESSNRSTKKQSTSDNFQQEHNENDVTETSEDEKEVTEKTAAKEEKSFPDARVVFEKLNDLRKYKIPNRRELLKFWPDWKVSLSFCFYPLFKDDLCSDSFRQIVEKCTGYELKMLNGAQAGAALFQFPTKQLKDWALNIVETLFRHAEREVTDKLRQTIIHPAGYVNEDFAHLIKLKTLNYLVDNNMEQTAPKMLLASNIPEGITEDDLLEHFPDLYAAGLYPDEKGNHSGLAFLQFGSVEQVDKYSAWNQQIKLKGEPLVLTPYSITPTGRIPSSLLKIKTRAVPDHLKEFINHTMTPEELALRKQEVVRMKELCRSDAKTDEMCQELADKVVFFREMIAETLQIQQKIGNPIFGVQKIKSITRKIERLQNALFVENTRRQKEGIPVFKPVAKSESEAQAGHSKSDTQKTLPRGPGSMPPFATGSTWHPAPRGPSLAQQPPPGPSRGLGPRPPYGGHPPPRPHGPPIGPGSAPPYSGPPHPHPHGPPIGPGSAPPYSGPPHPPLDLYNTDGNFRGRGRGRGDFRGRGFDTRGRGGDFKGGAYGYGFRGSGRGDTYRGRGGDAYRGSERGDSYRGRGESFRGGRGDGFRGRGRGEYTRGRGRGRGYQPEYQEGYDRPYGEDKKSYDDWKSYDDDYYYQKDKRSKQDYGEDRRDQDYRGDDYHGAKRKRYGDDRDYEGHDYRESSRKQSYDYDDRRGRDTYDDRHQDKWAKEWEEYEKEQRYREGKKGDKHWDERDREWYDKKGESDDWSDDERDFEWHDKRDSSDRNRSNERDIDRHRSKEKEKGDPERSKSQTSEEDRYKAKPDKKLLWKGKDRPDSRSRDDRRPRSGSPHGKRPMSRSPHDRRRRSKSPRDRKQRSRTPDSRKKSKEIESSKLDSDLILGKIQEAILRSAEPARPSRFSAMPAEVVQSTVPVPVYPASVASSVSYQHLTGTAYPQTIVPAAAATAAAQPQIYPVVPDKRVLQDQANRLIDEIQDLLGAGSAAPPAAIISTQPLSYGYMGPNAVPTRIPPVHGVPPVSKS